MKMVKYPTIFCTVGTTRFDAVCELILSSSTLDILQCLGCTKLTIQLGNSDLEPSCYTINSIQVKTYRFKDTIADDIAKADLVISHAGAGSCLEVLEAGKPLLVVVNEDLMDNHQLELAEQLQIDGHLYYCTCATLEDTLKQVDFRRLKPFPKADPTNFVKYLDTVLITKS